MKQLDITKKYYLGDLTDEQLRYLYNNRKELKLSEYFDDYAYFLQEVRESKGWIYLKYQDYCDEWYISRDEGFSVNAKELFEEENKSGWYRYEKGIGKTNWLMFHDFENNVYYGFNEDSGSWFYNKYEVEESSNSVLASNEEVIQRLTEEAEKRGYKQGVKIKALVSGGQLKYKLNDRKPSLNYKNNTFYYGGTLIMKDGVWAEIIVESAFKELHEWYSSEVFYYHKSKHGDNFYRVLEVVDVKNEFHDWRKYVKYQQTGSNLIFHKPEDMFYQEFKKVEV